MKNLKVKVIKTNRRIYEIVFIVILLFLMLLTTISKNKNNAAIKDNYDVTQGKITSFYPRGTEVKNRIEYSYKVNNKEFYRYINVGYKLEICRDLKKCQNKRYWVIYSPDNPANSLINLEIEIQEIENPEFPENLDDFQ